jgi:hypothetical protein
MCDLYNNYIRICLYIKEINIVDCFRLCKTLGIYLYHNWQLKW